MALCRPEMTKRGTDSPETNASLLTAMTPLRVKVIFFVADEGVLCVWGQYTGLILFYLILMFLF